VAVAALLAAVTVVAMIAEAIMDVQIGSTLAPTVEEVAVHTMAAAEVAVMVGTAQLLVIHKITPHNSPMAEHNHRSLLQHNKQLKRPPIPRNSNASMRPGLYTIRKIHKPTPTSLMVDTPLSWHSICKVVLQCMGGIHRPLRTEQVHLRLRTINNRRPLPEQRVTVPFRHHLECRTFQACVWVSAQISRGEFPRVP
jgi:hypothetical protein